jgi:hypothetical protein
MLIKVVLVVVAVTITRTYNPRVTGFRPGDYRTPAMHTDQSWRSAPAE